ncbi:myeloid cell surface antigen CD33-like [Budorcas taxicolor]|uniref:myeloid cell surface antigen CD33-like n=1 Tax=Budorcas taxicolor TaxID=37181 RepID=UPI00228398F9|nr:myeloid cell surface antigen CD33-like [Budorcas taxicolor]
MLPLMLPPLLPPLLWAGSLAQDPRFQLHVPRAVSVQEGLCVRVPCSFYYPREDWKDSDQAHGYWFREGAEVPMDAPVATNELDREVQKESQGRFHLLGDPRNKNCSLEIRDARKRDGGSYFFHVKRGTMKWSYRSEWFVLNVTGKHPGALEPGRPGNLTCSVPWACERATPPIFSWTSAAPSSLGPRTPFSSVLTLTPRPQDHGTRLTCQVKLPTSGAMVERTILLNVTCEWGIWVGRGGNDYTSVTLVLPLRKEILSSSPRCSTEPSDQRLSRKQHRPVKACGKVVLKSLDGLLGGLQ